MFSLRPMVQRQIKDWPRDGPTTRIAMRSAT